MTMLLVSAFVGALLGSGTDSADSRDARRSFLGMDVCLADRNTSDECEIQVFSPPEHDSKVESELDPGGGLSIDVLGTRLCMGVVPESVACDIRWNAADREE